MASCCKTTAAMVASFFFLALLLSLPCSGRGSNGGGCSAVSRSKTFTGDCESDGGCAAACRGEGYTDGYCFTDVADPEHPVCMCTAGCPPPPSTTTTRRRKTLA